MGASGSAFDINIVVGFLKKVSPYQIGSCVRLSDGQIAIIVSQNELNPLRPVVRLLKQPDVTLDLYKQREVQNIVINDICNISAIQL
jgi:hypothetical protein